MYTFSLNDSYLQLLFTSPLCNLFKPLHLFQWRGKGAKIADYVVNLLLVFETLQSMHIFYIKYPTFLFSV